MPTLKDIAQAVGVSISTVSRVINNDMSKHINEETRRKVWLSVQELGYIPNESARKLVKKSESDKRISKQIGVISSYKMDAEFADPFHSPIFSGIRKVLIKEGYVAHFYTLEEVRNEVVLHKLIHETNIDGLIVMYGMDPEMIGLLQKHVPAIVGINFEHKDIQDINFDHANAAQIAVRHLITQGHRKIGFIGGCGHDYQLESDDRYLGYRRTLREEGIELNPDWIVNTKWDFAVSYNWMLSLLDSSADSLPTAIFAASDRLAIPAMRAVTERNLRIPEDIAFIGVDNIDLAQYTSPPLSSVHVPKYEIGMTAAKILIDYIHSEYRTPFKILMPLELIVRQSSNYTR